MALGRSMSRIRVKGIVHSAAEHWTRGLLSSPGCVTVFRLPVLLRRLFGRLPAEKTLASPTVAPQSHRHE